MIQNREKKYLIAGLLITITFLAAFTSVVPKAEALKPKDHFTLASEVLYDLGWLGRVQIGPLLYKPNSLVADAISSYPSYYKMGCIGPDAFPDIIFGQGIVHPDNVGDNTNVYPDHYFGDGKSWSYDWLNALLTNAVNTAELGRKYSSTPWGSSTLDLGKRELAFTYGYMTHAAGDMFGHTWVNKYSGGPWQWNDNAIRHTIIEAYLGSKMEQNTGYEFGGPYAFGIPYDDTFPHVPDESVDGSPLSNFAEDTGFQNFLLETFYDGPAANALINSGDSSIDHTTVRMINGLVQLRNQIDGWLGEWNKEHWWQQPWWTWVPVGWVTKAYLKLWRSNVQTAIDDWMMEQSKIAYKMFVEGLTDGVDEITSLTGLAGWYLFDYLLAIIPPTLVGDLAKAAVKAGIDVAEWIGDLIHEIPGVKQLMDWFSQWTEQIKDQFIDWVCEGLFGMPLVDLKNWLYGKAFDFLFSSACVPANWDAAPFGYQTRHEIDNEISAALVGPSIDQSFDWHMFSVSYNIVQMSKMLLLDGPELNRLLADNGFTRRLYAQDVDNPESYLSLLKPGMCVMQGWIKSLDGWYQWMQIAPDGHSYGLGMPLWDDAQAREKVFKQVFHMGTRVFIDPAQRLIRTGQTITFNITIQNTLSQDDYFDISCTTKGDGTFTDLPQGTTPIPLSPLHGITYQVNYTYNGPLDFADAKITVTVAPKNAQTWTHEGPDILSDTASATIAVLSARNQAALQQAGIIVGQPSWEEDGSGIHYPGSGTYISIHTDLSLYDVLNASEADYWSEHYKPIGSGAPAAAYFQNFWQNHTFGGSFQSYTSSLGAYFDEICAFRTYSGYGPRPWDVHGLLSDGKYLYYCNCTEYLGHFDWEPLSEAAYDRFIVDNTPPSTTLDFNASQILANGPMIASTTIFNFTSTDLEPGTGNKGSGVAATYYCLEKHDVRIVKYTLPNPQPPNLIDSIRIPRVPISIPTPTMAASMFLVPTLDRVTPFINYTGPFKLNLPSGEYSLIYYSVDHLNNTEATHMVNFTLDADPPSTSLSIGEPKSPAAPMAYAYIVGSTPLSFNVTDSDDAYSSGVNGTFYRIRNDTYTSDWSLYTGPHFVKTGNYKFPWYYYPGTFDLEGYSEGTYYIDYYSTDHAGNVEPVQTTAIIIDNLRARIPMVQVEIDSPINMMGTHNVNADTLLTCDATGDASQLTSTSYHVFNSTFDTGLLPYPGPFSLEGLSPGDYTVEVAGVDSSGNNSTESQNVTLVGEPPTANFTYTPSKAYEQHAVTFDASGSTPGSGSMSTYMWDFGDGNITLTTQPTIPHAYALSGEYNVSLTIENSEGLSDSTWQTVNVIPPILGDANEDGKIDGKDIALVALSFGIAWGDIKWNPKSDVNLDGRIDGKDLVCVARMFGKNFL